MWPLAFSKVVSDYLYPRPKTIKATSLKPQCPRVMVREASTFNLLPAPSLERLF